MSFATAKVGGSGAGAFAEYLSEQADLVADYYGARELDGMAFTRVQGKATSYLGVQAGLTMEQFEDLHHGRWDGRQLSQVSYRPVWELDDAGKIVRDGRGHKIPARDAEGKMVTTPYRNSWIDAVWAAPKSVSEYMISTTPDVRARMIAAWDASCAEGVKAIEDRAYLLRRTVKGTYNEITRQQGSATERVRGAHLLVVPATQLAARHTEETIERGAPPDPHLHTHNAISTLAFLPDPTHPDGMRPLTVDEVGLKRFGEEANAIVMGDMARRMEEMGIAIEYGDMRDSRHGTISWEVAGVSQKEILFHSTNTSRKHKIIKAWEEKFHRPPTSPELNDELRKTRISKKQDDVAKEADSKGVWNLWKADKAANDIPAPARMPAEALYREPETKRRLMLHDRLMSNKGLCKDDADFTGDFVMNAIERSAVGLGFTQDELKAMEAEITSELVVTREAADPRFRYYSTKTQLAKEARIERGADHIAARPVLAPGTAILEEVIASQKHTLDPQQREAVIAASSGSWVHVEGHAGTGKSSSVGAGREALEKAGLIDQTIVVSVAAATAQRSGIKIGADVYGSVEAVESMVKKGVITPSDRNLWIIDEAAMMDTDHMDRLLMAARGQGRFVQVGDPAQLTPIGPAGFYEQSVAKHGSVMLDKTHRFKDHRDARDYALLRTGKIEDSRTAVENMAMRDRIHISDDRSDRVLDQHADYQRLRDQDREKKLTADDIRIIVETSNEDVDTANRFVQSDRKQRSEIRGDGVLVYDDEQGRSWSLHENDSILFLRSHLVSRRTEPVRNGTTGKIIHLNEQTKVARVKLEDEREIWVNLKEHEKTQPIGLAYAQHANKIQGGEVPVVQIMPGTEQTANANSAYSQLTRAQEEAHVYLDRDTHGDQPEEAVAESWAHRVDKRTATSRIREGRANQTLGLDTPYEKTTAERAKTPEPPAPMERTHQEHQSQSVPDPTQSKRQERRPYVPERQRENGDTQREPSPAAAATAVIDKEDERVKDREMRREQSPVVAQDQTQPERAAEQSERVKDRDVARKQSPVAEPKIEKSPPGPEKEEDHAAEPQQQPTKPEAERQKDTGSLREEGPTHLRQREGLEPSRGRSEERQEQQSPVERHSHLRERGQDRGHDLSR